MDDFLQLSVHQLVDFLLRTGDIDSRIFNSSSMQEGSRLHAAYQAIQKNNYLSEYALSFKTAIDEVQIELIGRADGIIVNNNTDYTIDEIKTTVVELQQFRDQNFEWHIGQAKCYAFMFAEERNLSKINVRLTYIRQGKEKEKLKEEYCFTYTELKQFVFTLLDDYLNFYKIILRKNEERNDSIKQISFPFGKFRTGQRELAKYCYGITRNGGRLFCEAPTGIGKTMSTLFPFIKAMSEDDKSKIFYLTAKTSGRESAMNAIAILKTRGLVANNIEITAKDKICFCKGKSCNPDECPYAKNYYSKIQQIIRYAILNYTTFDYQTIVDLANEHEVCPFELELDLSLFNDIIVCDYNYLFHPISYMKRFFDEDSSHYLALVDEAHNLVDRSRDMYSAHICSTSLSKARKSIRHSSCNKLKNQLAKMQKMFNSYEDNFPLGKSIVDNFADESYKIMQRFIINMQLILKEESKEVTREVLDFYLDVHQFMKISEYYSERYLSYINIENDDVILNLFCKDCSVYLNRITSKLKGTIFFSATFSPLKYFVNTLGGDITTDSQLVLSSPFPKENLKIMIAPKVSIKYKDRDASISEVREYIKSFISEKVGNYFVYVPSYEYLDKLTDDIEIDGADIFIQTKEMTDIEKEDFLLNFESNPVKTCVGFLVIGGTFSEGIDLVSDRLIGAVVVGIGLPKINFESDQIAEFFDEKDLPGKDYAYLNPGMNKVMQAVGRVIRSETDKGAVLLVDDRYLLQQYRDLFKVEWSEYEVVFSPKEVEEILSIFFLEKESN